MDQETLSLLAMCTFQPETANKVINNDTELLMNTQRDRSRDEYFRGEEG